MSMKINTMGSGTGRLSIDDVLTIPTPDNLLIKINSRPGSKGSPSLYKLVLLHLRRIF